MMMKKSKEMCHTHPRDGLWVNNKEHRAQVHNTQVLTNIQLAKAVSLHRIHPHDDTQIKHDNRHKGHFEATA